MAGGNEDAAMDEVLREDRTDSKYHERHISGRTDRRQSEIANYCSPWYATSGESHYGKTGKYENYDNYRLGIC